MESKSISEGIAAVLDYCRNYRSKETICNYEKACSMIKGHYDDSGQTMYREDIQQMIFEQTQTIINSRSEFHYVKEVHSVKYWHCLINVVVQSNYTGREI